MQNGVKSVHRFHRKGEDGSKIPTGTVLLTFASNDSALTRIILFYESFQLLEFRESPLRCFKCQRYGHTERNCRSLERCVHCAGKHPSAECTSPNKPSCVNCGGQHEAKDRSCPAYELNRKNRLNMLEHRIPFIRAKAMAMTETSRTYSSVAAAAQARTQPTLNNLGSDMIRPSGNSLSHSDAPRIHD